jgi:hypothetical protein
VLNSAVLTAVFAIFLLAAMVDVPMSTTKVQAPVEMSAESSSSTGAPQ